MHENSPVIWCWHKYSTTEVIRLLQADSKKAVIIKYFLSNFGQSIVCKFLKA